MHPLNSDAFIQDQLIKRREAKSQPVTQTELDRKQREINSPGYINRTFGKIGCKE